MSAVLFVAMKCSLSFSVEKTENGKIAVQQILAHLAVCVCMCMPITKIRFVSHVCVCVRGLTLAPCLPAYITSGLEESLKYLNLMKQLHLIIVFVCAWCKRCLWCTS